MNPGKKKKERNTMKKRLFALALAALMVVGMLSGCGSSKPETQTEPAAVDAQNQVPTIVMYYPLSGVPADQEMVAKAINEYVMEKLGINLVLQVSPYSAYENQLNLVVAGSEQVDIAMIFGNNVSPLASKGALLQLNDLVASNGQGIQDCLGDYLNAGSVNGVLYQIPVNRSLFYQSGVVLRKDILEKYNIDVSTIKSEEDLDRIFEIIKAGEPDMAMIQPESSGSAFLQVDYDSLSDSCGVLMNYGQNLDVVNLYATEEFREACQLHREWYKKGYIPNDVLTNTEGAAALVKAGKLLGYSVTVGPGTEQDKSNQCGVEMVMAPIKSAFSYTGKVNTFGWGILNNSKDPENAMKVLNLMYSDPTFLNMLDWGLEGVHYQMKEGSDRIITFADGVDGSNSGYFHNWSFAFGDQLSAYFWDGTEEDFPEAVRALNEGAIQSKAMGFAYDVTPVKNEYTAVTNVVNQYEAALTLGCIDPEENLPKFLEALEAAGMSKIVAEKQAQLDAWANASGVK